MTNQQWLFFRSVLPHSWIDEFCNHVEKTYSAQDAMVGYDDEAEKTSYRESEVRWVDTQAEAQMSQMLWTYIDRANRDAFDIDVRYLNQVQYTTYYGDKKGHYHWHHDVDWRSTQPFHRKLSVTVQLSDPNEYEGGDFEFDGDIDQLPPEHKEKGTVLVFPSFYRHRVKPITKGIRKSLVAWFEGPHWR